MSINNTHAVPECVDGRKSKYHSKVRVMSSRMLHLMQIIKNQLYNCFIMRLYDKDYVIITQGNFAIQHPQCGLK